MNKTLIKLEKKVIVSCQASSGEPFFEDNCMNALIKSAIWGGASALRLAGARDIKLARKITKIPIIGITKPDPLPENWKDIVYITETFKEAKQLAEAGADIIALDGTSRKRSEENLAEIIEKTNKDLKLLSMADISTLEEGLMCSSLNIDMVSTTLSGYTSYTLEKNNDEPDFDLLKKLVKSLDCPVILEGRIWTPEQVKTAFKLGAYAVVIGSAITRPHLITKRFVQATEG